MASTLSAVAADFLTGATPSVRRAPRITALIGSSSVGGATPMSLWAWRIPATERRGFYAPAGLSGDERGDGCGLGR
jgi:hypothetical protein